VLEVRGPIGPLVGALAPLPVDDLVVDPFSSRTTSRSSTARRRAMIPLLLRSASQARYLLLGSFALLCGFQIVIVGQAAEIERTQSFSRMAELLPGFLQRGLGSKAMLLATFKGTVAFGYFHPVVCILISGLAMYLATEPAHEVESGLRRSRAGAVDPASPPPDAVPVAGARVAGRRRRRDWRRARGSAPRSSAPAISVCPRRPSARACW
jgi:hypothetical protein